MHNSVEHDFVFYVAWGELMHSHKVAIIMDLGVSKWDHTQRHGIFILGHGHNN